MFCSFENTVEEVIFLNSKSQSGHLCYGLATLHFMMSPWIHDFTPIFKVRRNDISWTIYQPTVSPCRIRNGLIRSHWMIWRKKLIFYFIIWAKLLFSFVNESYIWVFRSNIDWRLTFVSFCASINKIFLESIKKKFFLLKFASRIFGNANSIKM